MQIVDQCPNISVIIPIYNADKYLVRCIDNILNQTYKDFELILVNDGSSDSSKTICERYVRENKQVYLFNQTNKGVSSARNKGIEISKGKWIAFIDADDEVDSLFLETLAEGIYKNESSLIVQGLRYILPDGSIEKEIVFKKKSYCKNEFDLLVNEIKIYKYGYPFAKLFNKAIIDKFDLKFNENISICEDLLFMFNYLEVVEFVYLLDGNHYSYHRFNAGSLSEEEKYTKSEYYLYLKLKDVISRNYDLWNISSCPELECTITTFLYRSIIACYGSNKKYKWKENISFLRQIRRKHMKDILDIKSNIFTINLIKISISHNLIFTLNGLLYIIKYAQK